jgi:hypothetical protein
VNAQTLTLLDPSERSSLIQFKLERLNEGSEKRQFAATAYPSHRNKNLDRRKYESTAELMRQNRLSSTL